MTQPNFSAASAVSFCASWIKAASMRLMAALPESKKNAAPQQPKDYAEPVANSGVWGIVDRKVIGDDWD